jgi:hypothetical protein
MGPESKKSMNFRVCAVGVFALCVLSSITVLARSHRAHTPAVEDDIREVVLRYQMAGWAKGSDKAANGAADAIGKAAAAASYYKVFFISTNDEDPTDELMKRFAKFPVRVEKSSQSEIDKKIGNAVVDKATKERGIRFRVGKITWNGSDSIEVEGGYFCDGLCASGETFSVRRKQGFWKVTGSVTHAIS